MRGGCSFAALQRALALWGSTPLKRKKTNGREISY